MKLLEYSLMLRIGIVSSFIVSPLVTDKTHSYKVSTLRSATTQAQEFPDSTTKRAGNLLLIDDTWSRLDKVSDHSSPVQEISDARIDIELPSDEGSNQDTLTWKVTSPITFEYRVVEAPGLLDPGNDALIFGHLSAEEKATAKKLPQRRLIVIDEKVDEIYGAKVRYYFNSMGIDYEILTLPMVEEEKDIELMLTVCAKMKKFNVDRRNEPVIAIGGGVCLDVVGLASTLFRRKTPYIRVPTTTLSYVDASIGAKTGVNFMESKNRLGAYIPPIAAFLDPVFIQTEEKRAISSGVAEMAKMAIMKSPELFNLLESHAPRLISEKFQSTDGTPERVLRLSIETMLEELAPNLLEKSLNRLVDFGHTVGQELEMYALGTEFELTHGESVAVDMAYSTVLSFVRGHINASERDRILNMLKQCQVPRYSPLVDRDFIDHAISERTKQSMGQKLPLPVGIGKGMLFNEIPMEEFYEALSLWTELVGESESVFERTSESPSGDPSYALQ